MPYETYNEPNVPYLTAKAIREAVARELARQMIVTPELVEARTALESAQDTWRHAVREATLKYKGR